jgi:hypothetical protein
VSAVDLEQQSMSFEVDRIGVPVLVRVSYFPNWTVEGAEGPYRAGANQMIVVPTSNEVTLIYQARTTLDWFFYSLTIVGIGLCIVLRRRGDVEYASEQPSFARGRGPEPEPDAPIVVETVAADPVLAAIELDPTEPYGMEWDRPGRETLAPDVTAPDATVPDAAAPEGSERIPGEAYPDAR